MWAIRKLLREPGLALDRVPIPGARPARRARPGRGGERLRHRPPHLQVGRLGEGTHQAAADARSRVRRHRRRDGRGRRTVVRGDYVSAESHITCGMCFHCRTGRAHMCERTQILGVDRDGAFAEFVVVPESVIWQNDRDKLPPEIATLQEPFGNAVFATSTQDLPGRTVAVLGCGPVGLFTIAIARASGAGPRARIRSCAVPALACRGARRRDRERRPDRRRLGWFHDAERRRRPRCRLRDVGRGGCGPRRVPDRPQRRRRRPLRHPELAGRARHRRVAHLQEPARDRGNGREVFATWYRTRWLLEHGVVDLRPLVTHRYPLTEFEVAFAELESGNACKIVLHPGGEPAMPLVSATPRARRGTGADAVRARQVGPPVSSTQRLRRGARRAPRGRHVQALQHAAHAAGAGRRDGRPRRGDRPLVEQLPRARQRSARRRRGDRGPAPLRRGNRLGALHLRHVRAARRARAGARGPVGQRGRADLRLLLERERGARPHAHRREHGDPLRRAQPRLDRRRDPAREARPQGDLPALRPGGAPERARRLRPGPAQARDHRRRLLDGRRPRAAARDRRRSPASTTRS